MEHKRELDESVNLHNCFIGVMSKMIQQSNKPYMEFIDDICKEKDKQSSVACALKKEVVNNLVKEIFVITNEVWKINPKLFNEGLIVKKAAYNLIKNKITEEGKTFPFNNRELYKRLRQSIVHNSEVKNNCVFNLDNFELNLGDVNGSDFIVNLKSLDLIELFNILMSNRQADYNINVGFKDCVIKNKKDVENSIFLLDENKNIVKKLDDKQIERVFNYFAYLSPTKEIKNESENIIKYLSLPENPASLLNQKLSALKFVLSFSQDSSFQSVLELNNLDSSDFLNIYFSIVSNLMFAIVSARTNQELEVIFNNCGIDLNNISHIRNALCHGRYFHNFNDKFYFYDGKKDLEFKTIITTNQFNQLMEKLAKGEKMITIK